ncbi:jhy protein homolog [Xenopus laevis]|uniref:Jhy protein homolog n=2 Tax=Xenopus laevis TaxID=8355 RepID=A0A974CFJ9_XENLA|nr:jhy protein homolog [Xenopus laevis]OCT72383.1 hypothetical protein XELAEV_18035361mg [Xenopus laevis]
MMGEKTRQPLEELDLNLSLDSLEESDSESLTQEIQYQSQLQDRIFDIEELVEDVQTAKGQNDGKQKVVDSDRARKEVILDGNVNSANTPNHNNKETGHKKISFQEEDSSYRHLRYDPNWKKHQSHGHSMNAYQDQDDFSDDSSDCSSFSDNLSVNNRSQHQKALGISGKTENKLPYRMNNKHANNVPNDFSNKRSESCEELSDTNYRVLVNKHRFKSAESKAFKSNKDFIETNKLTLGVCTTYTQHSYLKMYSKKKDAPEKVKEIKEINSVKKITDPRNQDPNLVIPSGKPNRKLQEQNLSAQKLKQIVLANEKLKDTDIPSHIIKKRQFNNLTPSISTPDLLLNVDLSKLKYTTTNHFIPKESPAGFFPAPKENYYDKHFLSSGQALNDDIAADNLHLNQWQIQNAQKQNKTHPPNQDSRNVYDVDEMENIILGGHSSNTSNDIILNQNHFESGYEPFNGVKVYDYLATTLQMEIGTFKSEEERNQNIHSNPESDGCQAVLKKTQEIRGKQRKIPKGYVNQEIKLGGIGPSYTISRQKKEQLYNQKEYAKAIQERNRNRTATIQKAPEGQTEQTDQNKGARHKSLEYAKNIPKPQPLPKPTEQKKEETATQPVVHDQFSSQIKLLEALQMRHEKEKVAVAALSALHIL